MRIAMISEHASPLAASPLTTGNGPGEKGLGGADGGGQNVFVAELATELGRQGNYVTVYTRRDAPVLPDRVRLAPGVTVEHALAGPPEHIAKDDLLPWMHDFGTYLERRWAADPPDVAHAHFWMSGLAAVQAAQAAGARRVPVVQTYHALGTVKRRHQGDKDTSPASRVRLERAIGRGADTVIATCSDEVAELAAMGFPRPRPGGAVRGGPEPVRAGRRPRAGRGTAPYRGAVPARRAQGVDTAIRALAHLPGTELAVAGGPPHGDLDADPEIRWLRRWRGTAASPDGWSSSVGSAATRCRRCCTRRASSSRCPGTSRSAWCRSKPWPAACPSWRAPSAGTSTPSWTASPARSSRRTTPRRRYAIRALLADPARRAAMGLAAAYAPASGTRGRASPPTPRMSTSMPPR